MAAHTHIFGCRVARRSAPCTCESTRYFEIFLVTVLICLVQGVGWYLSGSLSLLSDTFHVGFDGFAALISFWVARYIELGKGVTKHEEERVRYTGMLTSGSLLLVSLALIAFEAYRRYHDPSEVIGSSMVIAAIIGASGNIWQHRLLPHQHNSTKTAQRLHILGDLGSSLAVVCGGILIWITGKDIIDPILTFLIAFFIGYRTIKMMWSGGHAHAH